VLGALVQLLLQQLRKKVVDAIIAATTASVVAPRVHPIGLLIDTGDVSVVIRVFGARGRSNEVRYSLPPPKKVET